MKIGKFNISRTWLAIIIIILIIAGYNVIKPLFRSPADSYVLEKISKGDVLQEVSETGSVRATENISLGFKTTGRVARVYTAVGEDVKRGSILAELDSSQLFAQLKNYQAALEVAQKQYDKLINGLTPEDIKTYEDAVASAQHDLQAEYKDSLNDLNDAYTKIYNAYAAAVNIQNSYFGSSDQQGIKVHASRSDISANMQGFKSYLDVAQKSLLDTDIDTAISKAIAILDNVYNDLKVMRDQCDEGVYYSTVLTTDKSSLDTQKGNINTASSNVTTSRRNIASYKIALQKAQDNLALKKAQARPEDVDIYKAQIAQAEANVRLYQSQLADNSLRSPIDGKITAVNAKNGETVQANESVINLLSSEPFQIKVDIYEQDIVNVKVGDAAKIDLVAFPKQTFSGRVLSIDPGEKIVDNVVYYQVTIDFPDQPDGVKSGMTADIVIETNKKENVLRVSKSAVENIDGKQTVQIIKNKNPEDREITTGLEGNDYFEVLSGLAEGEEIITGKK